MNPALDLKCDPSLLALIPLAASAAKMEALEPLSENRALVMKRMMSPRATAPTFASGRRAGAAKKAAAKKTAKSATMTVVPKAVVFVECAHAETQLKCTPSSDVQVNSQHGLIRTAYLPLTSLGSLAGNQDVVRITGARRLRPCLDKALPAAGVPTLKTNAKLSGKGVVVGIIDSGIDGKHSSFTGRIHSVWDQTRRGKGVTEGSYGVAYTGARFSRAVDDEIGHGTHVAGIAAGADSKFRGVAHEATLVVVRTTFEDAHILDGIRYVFRIATELGLPAVVNLSLGGHWDAHDGSDALSRGIDELSGPGRIVCCSAGNEGKDNIHAQATLSSGQETGVRFNVPKVRAGEVGPTYVALNLWYDSPQHALEVCVRSPGGEDTPWQPVITQGRPTKDVFLGADLIRTATPPPLPARPQAHNILIELQGGGDTRTSLSPGAWQIRLRHIGTGPAPVRLDGWIIENGFQTCFFSGIDQVLDNMKIGSPGCSAQAITVAATTTRKSWPHEDGRTITDSVTVGALAGFSSEGPLRDGARKPDVAAPGQWIISARARQVTGDSEENVSRDFLAMQGTSMSCPFVSGLTALLLQRQPKLTPQDVRSRLIAASSIPGKQPGTFDKGWGHGAINATKL
jgi:subtilisin family serine protease